MLKVDHYYRIREMHYREGLSQRKISRLLGRSRKTVRKALENSTPPGYRRSAPPEHPVLDPFIPMIDAWMEEDKTKPPKQRHTAQRIYDRLCEEYNFPGHVSTVRRYVSHKTSTSGDVFFPLSFQPGEEAQVDWGDAWVVFNGVETKIRLFCVRLCYSTVCYVRAYLNMKLPSFLDGHVRALQFFGGVPERMAYDNLKTAVIKILIGHERELNERFMELRSHYVFKSRFCNPARGNEKGHVENLVKHAQRTFMTPLPAFTDIDALNEYLEESCRNDLDREVAARENRSRRELFEEERANLLPLPNTPFEACTIASTTVSKMSTVHFERNKYSVPVRWAHHSVIVKGFANRIEIHANCECVARHKRCLKKGEYVLDYEHYIPLLERKPGGIHNGRPFQGEPWGIEFSRMRRELEYRYGGEGTRKFVRILLLFKDHAPADVKRAVRECDRLGAYSDESVRAVLNFAPARGRVGSLDMSHRPALRLVGDGTRPMSTYDSLLPTKKEAMA